MNTHGETQSRMIGLAKLLVGRTVRNLNTGERWQVIHAIGEWIGVNRGGFGAEWSVTIYGERFTLDD